jgi:thiamine-phosphate pyrophosphorylase
MTMLADVKWPITYLITGGTASDQEFEEDLRRIQSLVSAAIEEGVTMVQLREKKLSGKHLFELASACAGLVRDSSTKLLVNDRTDIAVGARADGVHLTETSIPVAVIREKFGSDLLIGASVHSVDDAKAAAAGGADFAIYGPVFDSPGKGPAVGLEGLYDVCSTVAPFPVVGLGGIDYSNGRSVIEAGAAGVAAIRGLRDRQSIRSMVRSLRYG